MAPGSVVPPLLTIVTLLAAALVIGVVLAAAVRRRLRPADDDRGDWERTLADWRNLRDEGVLTEEEYRKLRTLVEPRTRIGMPDSRARHRPAGEPSGPDHDEDMN